MNIFLVNRHLHKYVIMRFCDNDVSSVRRLSLAYYNNFYHFSLAFLSCLF